MRLPVISTARHGRHLDVNGAGVPGGVALEALRLSVGAQPGRAVRDRAAVLVSAQASVSQGRRQPATSVTSVYWTNLAMLAMVVALSCGLRPQGLSADSVDRDAVAGAAGFWLFYVQHQFEGVYWERGDDWDYTTAALQGQFVLQTAEESCNGSPATSGFITSII